MLTVDIVYLDVAVSGNNCVKNAVAHCALFRDAGVMHLLLTSIHIEASPRAVPLGPAMLVSMLRSRLSGRLDTSLLNLYLHQSPSECADKILEDAPDIVGFSMFVWNRDLTLEIAELLKQRKPGMIVFAGGPEASTDSTGILKHDTIDFVLTGECEASIVSAMDYLLEGGDPRQISEVVSSAPIKDLSTLPSPFLDGTLDPRGYDGMLWELSRGCPFKCDFCYESRGTSGTRRFSMERIREELQCFVESGVEQVFVLDPTFNYNKKTAKEMLRLIAEEAPQIYYFFEVRAESIDAEMAELFASIDCSLQIGLQSASNTVLKHINRGIDPVDFESKILLLHEAGVVYGFDLIYGLPGDSFKGFCKSLDFAVNFIPNHVDIFPLAVLPGTRLQETASSFGLKHQPGAPYQVLSAPGFNETDMARAENMARAFDLFYNTGKAVPWFAMVLRALGMSPSAFIKAFVSKLKGQESDDIVALQKAFIHDILAQKGKGHLAAVAVDLIAYFGELEALNEEGISVSFQHNPIDLLEQLECGVMDLKDLAERLPLSPCSASLRFSDEEAVIQLDVE